MTLTVEIKINKELISGAVITNVTRSLGNEDQPGEVYDVLVVEKGENYYGIKDARHEFQVSGHDAFQTVWALVHKIAREAEARING